MQKIKKFDIIIVGGGHAGIEAALASSKMGNKILIITNNIDTIGELSCNPSIGGIGKSHLVKEIDALGGAMAIAADESGIQFKILNTSKGHAVRSTRVQVDRILYKISIKKQIKEQKNISIFQQQVDDIIINSNKVIGIITNTKIYFYAKSIIITTGTFLNGVIHIGLKKHKSGRAGEKSSINLANKFKELKFKIGRLKTGTPPRIDGNTINFSKLKKQIGIIKNIPSFSFIGNILNHPPQTSCWITKTNIHTHEIIKKNIKYSPLYNGNIKAVGPRYCPSIEDKINKFPSKKTHQIFLEPEGLYSTEFYPNGISTSLPFNIQIKLINSINGLKNSNITRPGYAIEYDFFDPKDLKHSLESKKIDGLFFAGQINGTTGYEEAAAQGLISGINASLYIKNKNPWIPKRNQSYLGVLINDLITQGISEPYRMFTSRAEYRLNLREDNADMRLTKIGFKYNLIDKKRWEIFKKKYKIINKEIDRLKKTWINIKKITNHKLKKIFKKKHNNKYNLAELLRRPEITYNLLNNIIEKENNDINNFSKNKKLNFQIKEQIEINIKYEGYIKKQNNEVKRNKKYINIKLSKKINYNKLYGLSNEAKQILTNIKPKTIQQAILLPGITPATISLLLIHLKKNKIL